jgi:Holliday junction DNA helicase RuvA
VAHDEDGSLVVEVAGVGYEVTAPLGTLGRTAADGDGLVCLFVHTHVREDALALFGFATERDRAAFRALIGVSNVGPRTAVAVLSALPADELARAIAKGDLGKLTAISGIGKKTAERLMLELRGKLSVGGSAATQEAAGPGVAPEKAPDAKAEILLRALTGLGYRQQEAERAVKGLGEARVAEGAIAALVKEALHLLAK